MKTVTVIIFDPHVRNHSSVRIESYSDDYFEDDQLDDMVKVYKAAIMAALKDHGRFMIEDINGNIQVINIKSASASTIKVRMENIEVKL